MLPVFKMIIDSIDSERQQDFESKLYEKELMNWYDDGGKNPVDDSASSPVEHGTFGAIQIGQRYIGLDFSIDSFLAIAGALEQYGADPVVKQQFVIDTLQIVNAITSRFEAALDVLADISGKHRNQLVGYARISMSCILILPVGFRPYSIVK